MGMSVGRTATVLWALSLLAAGCGGRALPQAPDGQGIEAADAASAATSLDAVSPDGSGAGEAETVDPASADASSAARPRGDAIPGTDGSGSAPSTPRFVVGITVEHPCAAPGQPQTITLHAERRAGVTMIIGYADRETHGHMNHGVADADGIYVWRIVVPLDAPPGPAMIGATSTGPNWLRPDEGEGGGTGRGRFDVAGPGAGCSP